MLHRGSAQMMGGGRSFATGMATGVDGDDVLEDFFGLFDDTIGDEPVVKTTLVGRGRHDTRFVQAGLLECIIPCSAGNGPCGIEICVKFGPDSPKWVKYPWL